MVKTMKVFGLLYLIANSIIFFAIAMFWISAWISGKLSLGYLIIMLPATGALSGYWMRKNRYGWWRSLIIGSNIIITVKQRPILTPLSVILTPEKFIQKANGFL